MTDKHLAQRLAILAREEATLAAVLTTLHPIVSSNRAFHVADCERRIVNMRAAISKRGDTTPPA